MPEPPGLDPDRLAAVREVVNGRMPKTVRDYYDGLTDQALAADDAHARSRGLVATGDGLTSHALRRLVDFVQDFAENPMCDCSPGEPGVRTCESCRALIVLAALPSSLLDNPEADR